MQDTSANPYTVRLNSARLVNAYMGDLRLAGSRRNTQEDRGEERTYKVTINTALDPLSLFAAGAVGAWFLGHKVDDVTDKVIGDVKVFKDLQKEATNQKSKTEENLKKRELALGKTTSESLKQNHEGGALESFGAAAGKFVFDALSKKTEDARKALKEDVVSTQPAKKTEDAPKALKDDVVSTQPAKKKEDAPKAPKHGVVSTQPAKKKEDAPKALKDDVVSTRPAKKKEDAPKALKVDVVSTRPAKKVKSTPKSKKIIKRPT